MGACLGHFFRDVSRRHEQQRLASLRTNISKAMSRCDSYNALERALSHLQGANVITKQDSDESLSSNGSKRVKRSSVMRALNNVSSMPGRIGRGLCLAWT